MKKDVDIGNIYEILKKVVKSYKVPVVDLIKIKTQSHFNVLVATILSARTKDETTIKVCERLFSKVKDAEGLKRLSKKEIEKLIYPVGFYKTKAGYLKELPTVLKEEFDGKIPSDIDDLLKLPGVGRKTANLVRVVGFKKPAMAIDVHCQRIFNRLGYIKTKTPLETEMVLRRKLPKKYWERINYLFVAFGQNICRPVSPWCSKCPIINYCNQVGVEKKR
ncbi:endonuclease III [Candidatus Woesearchaeota archaeon]|nr:endonuclease III [Candidatus Woesearchaeota archaeon]